MSAIIHTRPTPIGVLPNGSVAYDPASWLEDAVRWVSEADGFRLLAALLNSRRDGQITRQQASSAAYVWAAEHKISSRYLVETVRRLNRSTYDGPRAGLGTIWWIAEQHGWEPDVDHDRDMAILNHELADIIYLEEAV